MQEVHFPECFLILWCIDVQPWGLSNAIPHLQENTSSRGKHQGNEGESQELLSTETLGIPLLLC